MHEFGSNSDASNLLNSGSALNRSDDDETSADNLFILPGDASIPERPLLNLGSGPRASPLPNDTQNDF